MSSKSIGATRSATDWYGIVRDMERIGTSWMAGKGYREHQFKCVFFLKLQSSTGRADASPMQIGIPYTAVGHASLACDAN